MKEVIKYITIGVGILLAGTYLLFALGYIGNKYDETVGKDHANIERQNFEQSKSYVDGKVQDLENYRKEYQQTTSKAEKEQIKNYIVDEFSNFNENNIQNQSLKQFLDEMENGK